MMQKEWILAPPAPGGYLTRHAGFSSVLAQLLANRGFDDAESANAFIFGRDLSDDPRQLQDMENGVDRINLAIAQGQPIVVYGDFDADGVCATALLVQTLRALGGKVTPYIPDRANEGYGLNRPALRQLSADGVELIVTVDCGIRSVEEVDLCSKLGLDIIITDHHSIGPELPRALAVINPRREDCLGEPRLAGVGVAFQLAKALLLHRWARDRDNYPHTLRQSDLLDLVALGTVADVMPLNVSQNRRLVRHGLDTINELRRPGIAALAKVAGLKAGAIKASHIGFALGPRINAAGRLGSSMTALHLLLAHTAEEAMPYAIELQKLNAERRRLTAQAETAIREQLADEPTAQLIFAGDENLRPGILGLVAGRLSEAFYRPAVILEYGDEVSRASCRSIPEFDITRALDECADLLVRHGGHALAAGFTVTNGNRDALRQALLQKARDDLRDRALKPQLHIDCELDMVAMGDDLIAELELLEPTGHANPPATFLTRGLSVLHARRVGEDGRHLKLRLSQDGSAPIDAIGFGLGERAISLPRRIDAAYNLEMNEWNGKRSRQLRLLDIRPA